MHVDFTARLYNRSALIHQEGPITTGNLYGISIPPRPERRGILGIEGMNAAGIHGNVNVIGYFYAMDRSIISLFLLTIMQLLINDSS
ncbi:hypothetical protein IMCC3135_33335 [Granulosicoccus antarcticus IMCC3135]|uniref:Uncharacterized protein n=1 Tax=Granulosicoccus antarcticus IMCC3135 TaxID=1192854 RepID=A0A2Z2P288_9GAMM|nr:hypothetical protein IMCC3135_33335 [Granulosicoccus antarcticus IMCC3135]